MPVAGFSYEGPADTIPPDAGFRFDLSDNAERIAEKFDAYLRSEAEQESKIKSARLWSQYVTWDRCICEFKELWESGLVRNPRRMWLPFERGRRAYQAGQMSVGQGKT